MVERLPAFLFLEEAELRVEKSFPFCRFLFEGVDKLGKIVIYFIARIFIHTKN